MPYTFVDTIEPPATETMPAEALKLNGEYIENLMDARYCTYRTLYVRGREMLSPEVQSFETGVRDGSSFLSRRYPERILTIGFKLQAISNNYFRQAWNELNRILNVENAELIFYDEQDKYYIGTPAGIEEEPKPGSNFIKAEFNIICNDPFKYSVLEYEVEATEDEGTTFVFDYNGTYKSYPVLEADFYNEDECGEDGSTVTPLTGAGDCGYVAWFKPGETDTDDAKIIQCGDPEESDDAELYEKSQTLFTQRWREVSSWTNALNSIWLFNVGLTSGDDWVYKDGTTGFVVTNAAGQYYLTPRDYGLDGGVKWHGPTVSRALPADASGEVGAKNFTAKFTLKMCIGDSSDANKQRGNFQFLVGDENGQVITGMHVFKDGNGTNATLRAYMGGCSIVKDLSIDLSFHNSHFGSDTDTITNVKTCILTKTGATVDMNLGGTVWSFTDSSIEDMAATTISFVFGQMGDYPTLQHNGIYECDFVKNNCETWGDIPNKFGANNILVADCGTGQIYLNDAPVPAYGVLGNNWEGFYLSPGINQIGFSYSDWCSDPPTSKMRYREVYL